MCGVTRGKRGDETMITKLTKEQKAQMPNFINKWVNMPTTPFNKEKAFLSGEKGYHISNLIKNKKILKKA